MAIECDVLVVVSGFGSHRRKASEVLAWIEDGVLNANPEKITPKIRGMWAAFIERGSPGDHFSIGDVVCVKLGRRYR